MKNWRSIWLVDFEFKAIDGERPDPICVVAHDLVGGRQIRLWIDPDNPPHCPYGTGADDLFIAYYASAEIGCHLALGWPVPKRIIDLCIEFKLETCGLQLNHGRNLLGALLYHKIDDSLTGSEKSEMQQLAARGGPYSGVEKAALIEYCASDVCALSRLWKVMSPSIDTPRALIRGRYMAALAEVERRGVPLDIASLETLRKSWPTLKTDLIAGIGHGYGVYEGETFVMAKFEQYLIARAISWPRTPTGRLNLSDDTFSERSKLYPELQPLKELRATIGRLKLFDLAVGHDGRNRTLLGAFGSKTGRNQPSNTKFIYGPATWVRHLIRPEPGTALAYVDYEQQEFGIAAALSNDESMWAAYESGDPYLAFAKMAGAVPSDATKQSHAAERERFKVCALAVQYGMGASRLAQSLGLPLAYGRDLMQQHRRAFPKYWDWVEAVGTTAQVSRQLLTRFGWKLNVTSDTKPTTLANWPCQANGAEMLRLAVIATVETGIGVCATVHDALLVEGSDSEIESTVQRTEELMQEASKVVLGGKVIRTDAKVIRYPERCHEPRGKALWDTLMRVCPDLSHFGTPTCPN